MYTSDNRPVLYHAVSSYQLLEVILHRRLVHPEQKAVLILPDFITEKYPQVNRLVSGGWFDDVRLFPYTQIPHREESFIIQDVTRFARLRLPCPIGDFSEIYMAGAHFYFSLYLIENRIPFTFFEDAAGLLSRPGALDRSLSATYPIHAQIARHHGLFSGENPLIRRVICLKSAQTIDVSDKRFVDFCVEDALSILPPKQRKKLVRFFLPRPIFSRADAVLLTQHFAALGLMSLQQQKNLYLSAQKTDLRGLKLLIKPHPDDTLDYTELFPRAACIRRPFPAELLPYVFFGKPPGVIYTFNSSGCENLRRHFTIKQLRREAYGS